MPDFLFEDFAPLSIREATPRLAANIPSIILQNLDKSTLRAVMNDPRALGKQYEVNTAASPLDFSNTVDVMYRQLSKEKLERLRSVQREFIVGLLHSRDSEMEMAKSCFLALKGNMNHQLPPVSPRPGENEKEFISTIVATARLETRPSVIEVQPESAVMEILDPRDKRRGQQLEVKGESGTGIAWMLADASYALKEDEDVTWQWVGDARPFFPATPKDTGSAVPILPKIKETRYSFTGLPIKVLERASSVKASKLPPLVPNPPKEPAPLADRKIFRGNRAKSLMKRSTVL